jgi:DNA-binding XRE family transcriptional regulator
MEKSSKTNCDGVETMEDTAIDASDIPPLSEAFLEKAGELPPLPEPDANGNYPAVEYARASLARNLIRDRVAAGLPQRELVKLAGVRVETLCRIETGKHTPSVPTVDKLDRALKLYVKSKNKRRGANEAQ